MNNKYEMKGPKRILYFIKDWNHLKKAEGIMERY